MSQELLVTALKVMEEDGTAAKNYPVSYTSDSFCSVWTDVMNMLVSWLTTFSFIHAPRKFWRHLELQIQS